MRWLNRLLFLAGAVGVLAVGVFHEQGPSEYNRAFWGALIGAAVSLYTSKKASDSQKKAAKQLANIAAGRFEAEETQRFLPPSLRYDQVGSTLETGLQGIGDLIRNPGRLSPTVADAIRQRLAGESENIAQNFRGIGSQQAGQAARGNVPVSIKGALESALAVAQERAQRGARREALMDSDTLRRQDLGQTYSLLDTILQYISSGRGQAIPGLGAAADIRARGDAALAAGVGSAASNVGSAIDQWQQNRAAMQSGGGSTLGGTGWQNSSGTVTM